MGSSLVRLEETTSPATNLLEWDLAKCLLKGNVHTTGIVKVDFDKRSVKEYVGIYIGIHVSHT